MEYWTEINGKKVLKAITEGNETTIFFLDKDGNPLGFEKNLDRKDYRRVLSVGNLTAIINRYGFPVVVRKNVRDLDAFIKETDDEGIEYGYQEDYNNYAYEPVERTDCIDKDGKLIVEEFRTDLDGDGYMTSETFRLTYSDLSRTKLENVYKELSYFDYDNKYYRIDQCIDDDLLTGTYKRTFKIYDQEITEINGISTFNTLDFTWKKEDYEFFKMLYKKGFFDKHEEN